LKIRYLALEVADLGLENENPANAGERHSFASETDDPLNVTHLLARITALTTVRPCRLNHLFSVEAAEERWSHPKHFCNLTNCVKSRTFVVECQW
jgi:hypothetical protein